MVSRRTGLSPHVIRIWERRYSAVSPSRTGTNRRRYSDEDIERLTLLRRLTEAGHSIGSIAKLPSDELRGLAKEEGLSSGPVSVQAATTTGATIVGPSAGLVAEALRAVKNLDADGLERVLSRAAVELGQSGLLQQVVFPLVEEVGEAWRTGHLKVAHEHLATAAIRTFLGQQMRSQRMPERAPLLLIATPAGQLHELGAVMAGAVAVIQGWRVLYLGPNVPSEEIAGAALQSRARAVALSVVYPEDDPYLPDELRRLRELLPAEIPVLVGGRAASAYTPLIEFTGTLLIRDLPGFREVLDGLRRPASPASHATTARFAPALTVDSPARP